MSSDQTNTSNEVPESEEHGLSVSIGSESDSGPVATNENATGAVLGEDVMNAMTLDELRTVAEKMTEQYDTIKSRLWLREAVEKTRQKRKRVFSMPARKKYKIDQKLEKNQETKTQYEELCRSTDLASEEAKLLFDKKLEQDQKITALEAERDHAHAIISAWSNRSKSVRAQLAILRSNMKQTKCSARKARKLATIKLGQYNKARRALKQTLAVADSRSQLARKEAELQKIKERQKANEDKLKEIVSSTAVLA
jgi:hypothetical protein